MNNRWGTNKTQCIQVLDKGFKILQQDGQGMPASYPAIFYGCHFTNCSPSSKLPLKLSSINSVTTDITYNFVTGSEVTYNAAYDIWLDPEPNTTDRNQQEIMIWLTTEGSTIQPIGKYKEDVHYADHNWAVWTGNNGKNEVVSYVAYSKLATLKFSILDFVNDAKNRGLFTNNWYLTSIQAGFEPWKGGAGLAVNNFDVVVS